jgi:hypothetical protein
MTSRAAVSEPMRRYMEGEITATEYLRLIHNEALAELLDSGLIQEALRHGVNPVSVLAIRNIENPSTDTRCGDERGERAATRSPAQILRELVGDAVVDGKITLNAGRDLMDILDLVDAKHPGRSEDAS